MEIGVIDEMPGLAPAHVMTLRLDRPVISLADLIRARVEVEVERLEAVRVGAQAALTAEEAMFRARVSQFLVMPDAVERALNGDRGAYGPGVRALQQRRNEGGDLSLDSAAMVAVALDAFQRGAFFVLTGERQLIDLDEEIDIARTTDVTFIKLTPLKGG